MKKSRIISLMLTAIIVFGCFYTNTPAPTAAAADVVVTASADDFAYTLFPNDNPTYVILDQYNGSAQKIKIPEKIEGLPVKILRNSFNANEKIEYIEIPSTVETISIRTFYRCSSLTDIVVSPANKMYSSDNGILFNRDKTTLVTFPSGRSGSFTIPKSVVTIANFAFNSCYKLTDVKMYNNVLSIGASAFLNCWNLTSIKLSDNLSVLGARALAYCDSLTEIHLPSSLKTIGNQALIGGIDSNNNVYYNFVKGLYYVKGTPSENFVKNLHLVPGYTFAEPRTITDIDTNITLYDSNNALPSSGKLDLKISVIPNNTYSAMLPVRYSKMAAYDVSFTKDGAVTPLSKECVIRFNSMAGAIPTATKVFVLRSNKLVEKTRAPQAAFVGTTFNTAEKFVVISNTNFSLKGDIDGDGIHSIYDARIALAAAAKLIKNLTPAQTTAANVDGTAGITTSDAREVLKYAAGIKK